MTIETAVTGEAATADPALAAGALEQQSRAAAYGLIAALLRSPPDAGLLRQIGGLPAADEDGDDLSLALAMLGLAARSTTREAVDDEFHDLFIGLGRGELMPYASWYLTGFLMERPLGLLRDDLARLGIEREPSVREPEDHMAALCEVMLLLIREGRDFDVQARFFERHLACWCDDFFRDLSSASAATFYRNLGRFGSAFLRLEQRYFSMQV